MPNNKIIVTPPRLKRPSHISETGVLLNSQAVYKKGTKASRRIPPLKI